MKRCTKCGLEKDDGGFYTSKKAKDGLCSWCKKCVLHQQRANRSGDSSYNAERRAAYSRNSEKMAARQREYRANNTERIAESRRNRLLFGDDIVRATTMLRNARHRAKSTPCPYSILPADICPLPTVCPVLGLPLQRLGGPNDENNMSIDRTIPRLGYVKGNVVVMSRRANTLKSDATIEELELVLAYMKRHAAQQDQQEQGSEPCNT